MPELFGWVGPGTAPHFRRDAVRSWFEEMRPPEPDRAGVGVGSRALGVAGTVLRRVPAVERRIRSGYQRRVLRSERAFLDLFLAGDGGRRAVALEAASGEGRG